MPKADHLRRQGWDSSLVCLTKGLNERPRSSSLSCCPGLCSSPHRWGSGVVAVDVCCLSLSSVPSPSAKSFPPLWALLLSPPCTPGGAASPIPGGLWDGHTPRAWSIKAAPCPDPGIGQFVPGSHGTEKRLPLRWLKQNDVSLEKEGQSHAPPASSAWRRPTA